MMRLFFNIIYLFILFSCRKERCVGMLSICNLLFKDFLSQTYSDQTDRMVPPYSGKYAAQAANHSPSTQPITTQHADNHNTTGSQSQHNRQPNTEHQAANYSTPGSQSQHSTQPITQLYIWSYSLTISRTVQCQK